MCGCSGGPFGYNPSKNKSVRELRMFPDKNNGATSVTGLGIGASDGWLNPENHSGCCNGNNKDDCSQPSRARKGSPLWEWEQKYGKVINKITEERGADGRFYQVHVKTMCQPEVKKRSKGCCAISYRVTR